MENEAIIVEDRVLELTFDGDPSELGYTRQLGRVTVSSPARVPKALKIK
jgi:hypothetical protein